MEVHGASLQSLLDRIEGMEERIAAHSNHYGYHSVARPEVAKPEDIDDWTSSGFNHDRAAPQNLLQHWPTIASLLQASYVKRDDGLVVETEDRGVSPSWTRAERIQMDGPTSPARRNKKSGNGIKSSLYADGTVKAGRGVDLNSSTIKTLHDSYIRNFHVVHPFLDNSRLRCIISRFVGKYGTGRPLHEKPPERSPDNCIVYLVLALGQISLHPEPLQGTVDRGNMDVTPSLGYYTKAAEILGDHCDGNELVHVQMFLLAGLYKGQLARVNESMSWITMAGRAVLTLLDRYSLWNADYWNGLDDVSARIKAGQERIKDTQQSLVVLASWCCLQLESEILADLKAPGSGIQQIEGLLCLPSRPKNQAESDDGWQESDSILIFYNAQLWLQLRLNEVRRQLYGPKRHKRSSLNVQDMQRLDTMLNSWRSCLPIGLAWHDNDPPPSGILAARLRATYWEALYLVHRPVLDYELHIMPSIALGSNVESAARDEAGNPRNEADVHLFKAIRQLDASEIRRASKRCVDAAMKSLAAFHNVPGRLVVPNIHRTAHA